MNRINQILIENGVKEYIDGFGDPEVDADAIDVAVGNCIEETINLAELDEEENPMAFYLVDAAFEFADFQELADWYNSQLKT